MSHRLGRLGLLERENAAGLNGCLAVLADSTIAAFAQSLQTAGLGPGTRLFLTQNDGTLLGLEEAARYPVLTFASGPTNSIRGAALLGGVRDGLVVDVGGTTADFGALVNGYPRQANAAVDVGGVRTLFQLPDLVSIGLGGGSLVRADPLRIGPASVGRELLARTASLGGDSYTLSDAALAAGRLTLPGASPVAGPVGAGMLPDVGAVLALAAAMIGEAADRMKLAAADMPLVAVGGGAFAVPDRLAGVSEVVRPDHAAVANAVGAALAEVSGECDQVFDGMARTEAIEAAVRIATERAVAAGAVPASVSTVEVEDLPLAYLPGDARRLRVRVVGALS
jgi:N-methylhydantoinase A/oxoprolinase/acetone carboxylase beta subunit